MKRLKPTHKSVIAVIFILFLLPCIGCGSAYKITPIPADRELEESVVFEEGGLFPSKIALIDISGVLQSIPKSTLFGVGENPVSLILEKLDKAAKDKSVKALILRINSPGGTVTASDLIHSELQYFKERTKGERPIVTVMMDVAASGGYYIACATDEIVAHPTTVTGSVGVIMQMVNFAGTMFKIGVQTDAITSGKMKDAGSPFRLMKPEEREIFQKLVDQFYDRFVETVAKGRPKLDEAKVRELADGRIWSAQQALELGFIDRIGTLRNTIDSLKEQLELDKVKVVAYHRPMGWQPNIYAKQPAREPQVNMVNIELPDKWPHLQPQFLYLWSPGQ